MASTGAKPKVSAKMKKGVEICEEILGIKCTDIRDFDTVHKFLDENLPKVKDKDIREFRKESDKQLNAIAIICKKMNVSYSGKNSKDASEFISKYYDQVFGGKTSGKKRGSRR